MSQWLERRNVKVLNASDRHWGILSGILAAGPAHGALVTDAHLAALAIEHGATLATVDKDFARFPGLPLSNPLLPSS